MMSEREESYSTTQAMRAASITHRQANYWCQIGLIFPRRSLPGPDRSGNWRKWSLRDIVVARCLACVPDEFLRPVSEVLARRSLAELPEVVEFGAGEICEVRVHPRRALAQMEKALRAPSPLSV